MASSYAWLGPIVIALIGALAGYVGVSRKASGRISHTEASKLWDEASSLREVYQGEIARLRMEIERLDDEIEALEATLKQLQVENEELHRDKTRLERRLDEIENHAAH